MPVLPRHALLLAVAVLFCAAPMSAATPSSASAPVDFQRQIRPILSDNCFLCHGPDKGTRMAGLRLDIRAEAFAARKNGSPIVPGKPDESLLIKRVFSENTSFRMPPVFSHKTLTPDQKETLRRWIQQGAPWKEHWAFIPPVRSAPPTVKTPAWVQNPIDSFILARLESVKLQPAAEADRRTLLRRVTLDLTGLPPTPEEVGAFVKDRSPNAYEKVVDRLLASPRYGEHRARYWLDAARYADTQGLHIDNYREMWPYRDWVIQAFNRNMPFDQFTVTQLAGDLLPNPTLDQQIGSGFHRCNVTTNEGGSIPAEVEAMYAKDRADTTGTVWLGLTVGCATCHDHKFDPIAQKDFYALTAFFRNTTQNALDGNVPDTPPVVVVPKPEDRSRWDQLNTRRTELRQMLTHSQPSTEAAFESWMQSTGPKSLAPPSLQTANILQLDLEKSSLVLRDGRAEPLSLTEGAAIEGSANGGKALRFKNDAGLALRNFPEFDSDKPFTISALVYIPKEKGSYVVASQLGPVGPVNPDSKSEAKHAGWIVDVSGEAPGIRLMGEDGKYISARPSTDYQLKADTWYHLSFSYDGSRQRNGLQLFVDGKPVPTYGTGEDIEPLRSSIKTQTPLVLGGADKQHFNGGAIEQFQVLDRAIDEEDAELLVLWSTVSKARAKDPTSQSDRERQALLAYYTETIDPAATKAVAELHQVDSEREQIKRRGAVTFVMQERTDSKPVAHVLFRGRYDAPKDEVRPGVPSVLPPMPQSYPQNRLGLAKWLVDANNPLTARVTVNRFWQEIFGNGIVKTAEDFGSQGEAPSHPELLDWLAVDFRDSGWDVKKLVRLIVTSSTYRQAAALTDEKLQADPDNRLLSRGPRFRMDGEMIRDYALAVSGLLQPTIGGPSVKPYQPANVWETVAMDNSNTRFYKPDTGDKLYRRSLYTFWKRSAPPASMDIFNAPSRETCTVRRERTNTPLQALVTMNDPQFVEAARVLAQDAMLSAHGNVNKQINYIGNRLLARSLDVTEREIVTRSYKDYLSYYGSRPADSDKLLNVGEFKSDPHLRKADLAALTMVANELMNLDEVLVK